MAAMNFFDDFETLWAQAGNVEAIEDNQYKAGWAYIGATPPSVEQFNKVQQLSDQKAAWLFAQFKGLAEKAGFDLTAATTDALTRGVSRLSAGVVGTMRNARMSVAAASQAATFTADEIVVQDGLGGAAYRLDSFNESINLATIGAGGMDTGTAPANGYVALYAIYNPTTGASALLARNATSAAQPEVYGGANMPAGYTASALVSVWPTDANGRLVTAFQNDRCINYPIVQILNTTTQGTHAPVAIAGAIPKNGKSVRGEIVLFGTNTNILAGGVSGSSTGIGYQWAQANMSAGALSQLNGSFAGVPIITEQTLFYTFSYTGGSAQSLSLFISGYTF